ncbi:hypothetical protein HJC23_003153 [Cyclotella cryptica]|uniref:Uncharacterized protein n=1 Tax=Cyclotella cryptica TaxID=29204 RepID=A0ABD3PPF6_9STRA|eukprot:CCRYP_012821-RA/>CCRYP_012821-RA protein AED:0.05 eAED:0.05 QI:169/1/1/1/0.42/0.25/8/1408/713
MEETRNKHLTTHPDSVMAPSSPSSPADITRRISNNTDNSDSPPQIMNSDPLSPSNSNHYNECNPLRISSSIETESHFSSHKAISGTESMIRFLLLPSQVFIVLLLEFLNSFRSFGLRFVLYNYITNEYGIGDTQAGILLGIKGFVDIGFGLAGSILVDIVGVRRVSLVAFSVALIGRTLLAFGRSEVTLYPALFLFSPCGDALLSTGLYAVALKKLTTPLTRPLAFAISYATFNLAGAMADLIIDKMRASVEDYSGVGGVYTPVRQFIVLTWMVLILTALIAYFYLQDLSVLDPDDLDRDGRPQSRSGSADDVDGVCDTVMPVNATPAKPLFELRTLKRWFPNEQILCSSEDDSEQQQITGISALNVQSTTRLLCYKIYKTKHSGYPQSSPSLRGGVDSFFSQVLSILRLRNTWIVLVFGFLTMTVGMNWSASEIVLPPFLERRFGESVPIYTIQSINLIMCLIFPPFLASMTADREVFQIIMPGLWLMAASPIFVAISPNVVGACLWQVFMTFGEVLWSPRQDSWTADLAPTGKEGLFFAVSRARAFLGPLADFVLGMMNERYNTNCVDCRDQYGHFCDTLVSENNVLQCNSIQEECGLFLDNQQQSCPTTCVDCPTWQPTNPATLWYLLMLASLATPLSIWICLPFLRGQRRREDRFYGIFYMGKNRLKGICGFPDEHPVTSSYDHVNESTEIFDNNQLGSVTFSGNGGLL